MLTWVGLALACEESVLRVIPPATVFTPEATLQTGHTKLGDQALAGARVAIRSAHPVSAWEEVLEHPERQVEWLPAQFGVKRMERFGHTLVYEQLELSFLLGALKVPRQFVIEFGWRDSGARFENCWILAPRERYIATVGKWESDAPWQTVGMGAWRVDPLPDGGTAASYELWAQADILPAVQAWGISRTLPDLVRAFDAQAGEMLKR